jgi:hypothetical protein
VLNGQLIEINPEYAGDWIDLQILKQINHLIGDSGLRFEVIEAFDQTAVIISLTSEEKHKLESELGWFFIDDRY